jgi:hypothetical protein
MRPRLVPMFTEKGFEALSKAEQARLRLDLTPDLCAAIKAGHEATLKTCPKGHPLSLFNAYERKDRPGTLQCRRCNNQAHRRRRGSKPTLTGASRWLRRTVE